MADWSEKPESRLLVLASGSPRRRLLLGMAGYEFEVAPPHIDESMRVGEPPEEYVVRIATEKACAVAAKRQGDDLCLGLDTSVVYDGRTYGKPQDAAEAVSMLLSLAGRTHTVYTGYTLAGPDAEILATGIDASRVTMRPVSVAEAEAYAATGEPLDKAGAYALQGRGRGFVDSVEGLRSTVIGLPLEHIVHLLTSHGVLPTRGG